MKLNEQLYQLIKVLNQDYKICIQIVQAERTEVIPPNESKTGTR